MTYNDDLHCRLCVVCVQNVWAVVRWVWSMVKSVIGRSRCRAYFPVTGTPRVISATLVSIRRTATAGALSTSHPPSGFRLTWEYRPRSLFITMSCRVYKVHVRPATKSLHFIARQSCATLLRVWHGPNVKHTSDGDMIIIGRKTVVTCKKLKKNVSLF